MAAALDEVVDQAGDRIGRQLERLHALIGVAVRIHQDLADDLPAGRVAGQADMQPGVAIEDVVAATADDGVVALATQEDIAAVERHRARDRRSRRVRR